jgi:hypothetical protein
LPAQGSDTEWYKNVLQNPSLHIDARGAKAEFKVVPVTKAKQVSTVVEKFRAKYGDSGIKLYSKTRQSQLLSRCVISLHYGKT